MDKLNADATGKIVKNSTIVKHPRNVNGSIPVNTF